jgi:hypothetical protein
VAYDNLSIRDVAPTAVKPCHFRRTELLGRHYSGLLAALSLESFETNFLSKWACPALKPAAQADGFAALP